MAPKQQKQPSAAQLEAVKTSVRALLSQPSYDDGSIGPVLVRLAWHAAGTYCATTGTGGSNGAGMRWEAEGGDPANAGLSHARAFLEPVKREHPWITYSDLWTLASVVAIEEMGGPASIPWKGGRTDFYDENDKRVPPRGRLPDAAHATPADHLREVFGRMGFGDREIVALSGAHNLGRCHGDRSGFVGKWVNNPTRFSNQYFRLLSKMEWKEVTLESGVRQFSYVDEDAEEGEEGLMMLPTDMALLSDAGFKPWVDRYAADKDLFFADFEAAFSKLLELGLRRHPVTGRVLNDEIDAAGGEEEAGYWTAPKKSDRPTAKL